MLRHSLIFGLILVLAGSAALASPNLGATPDSPKNNHHVGQNPGTPDGRQGGEDMATAVLIPSLPFNDTGNTSDNLDDYDEVCPYGPHTSPDVVYTYTPPGDGYIDVDLCGSGYDTKTFIYDSDMNVIACNDDFYFDDACGVYVSMIERAVLVGGETYFIVIDGYYGDSGDYMLEVRLNDIIGHPCIYCPNDDEDEPSIVDGYEDAFNGGCNSPDFGNPFSTLVGDENGDLIFCGYGGWYLDSEGGNSRDTDWYTAVIGANGIVEWLLDAEQDSYGFLLGPNDCETTGVLDSMQAYCSPQVMVIQGTPGETVWLWVGSTSFTPPAGYVGNEYPYHCYLTGLMEGTVAVEEVSFDGIKSLYR